MGHHGVVRCAVCAAVVACAGVTSAHAGTVLLDNGITGDGHYDVQTDDFGSYGTLVGSSFNDFFQPIGAANTFSPTYMTGAYLFVTTPGPVSSKIMLSDYKAWNNLVEPPPQPDGIVGDHAGLTRTLSTKGDYGGTTVTTQVAGTSTEVTSAFAIEHVPSGLRLDVALVQTIMPGPSTGSEDLVQVYTITNNGTVALDLNFSFNWEADLYYSDNSPSNELVGIGPGFCSLYMHDPGSSVFGIALGDGGSTVSRSAYYGGKEGTVPDSSGPTMATLAEPQIANQHVWNASGIPATWRNYIAGAGYNAVGDSGSLDADATLGVDYRFTIAVGATEKIHLIRRYGAISIPCPPSASCGNGVVDPGETCDGADTAACNGATCTPTACGDGYINTVAGETCESAGIDTNSCNGTLCTTAACGDGYANAAAGELCDNGGETASCIDCTSSACGDGYIDAAAGELCDDGGETAACNVDCTPSACGDGYINAAAAEQCDGGALCDPTTCTVTYTIGGGCGGCGAGGDAGAPFLLVAAGLGLRRRRKRSRRVLLALMFLCLTTTLASAGSVTLTNGVTGVGASSVSPDDYGSYGFLIGQQFDDEFIPAGVANTFTPTYLTGPELYITTPSNVTSSVLLSGTKFWYDFVENPPPQPDGIDGPLARTVTTGIVASGNTATSAFRVADTGAMGILLDVGLVQTLASDATAVTSQFDQVYTITNNGTATLSLVFHLAWDPDLFFNGANKSSDDHVGASAGVCGAYAHDGDARWAVALGNGPMSTVPMTYFFAGKEGFVPGAGPAFAPISALIADQHIWINKGMPAEWRNYVVGPGIGAVGESDPALAGDATLGTEYRFTIAAGATETIHIRRYYGTTVIPCFVSAKCGNGVIDPGELCDTTDTIDCNGNTCTASACGDGYMNTTAGETCESGGMDTTTCNGALCTAPTCGDAYTNQAVGEACDDGADTALCNADCTAAACGDGYANLVAGEACDDAGDSSTCNADCSPAMCGDGYVNAMASEQCESGQLCDMASCTVTYTLGGGCAGCGAGGDAGGPLLFAVAFVIGRRRRHPARAA